MLTVWSVVLVCCIYSTGSLGSSVCTGEAFQPRCSRGEVILLQSARYGRMELGRCVKTAYGQLGCSTDVLHYIDKQCSGKQKCDISVVPTNSELAAGSQCNSDLVAYLEVEHNCLKVLRPPQSECEKQKQYGVPGQGQHITLSSLVTDETGCGSGKAPWVIKTSPGQKVTVTLIDFNPSGSDSSEACRLYGYIIERGFDINETICGGRGRDTEVYRSRGSNIEILVLPSRSRRQQGSFLVNYKVTGCPDLSPPAHAWYERDGDTAVIGCEWSQHEWQLTCESSNWIGVVGNCSAGASLKPAAKETEFTLSPVVTISLIVGLGVIVVTLTCIVIIGCICLKRNTRDQPHAFVPWDQQQTLMYQPCRAAPILLDNKPTSTDILPNTNTVTGHPRVLDKGDFQHIYETPLPNPESTQRYNLEYGDQMTSATLPCRGTMPGPTSIVHVVIGTDPGDTSRESTWGGTKELYDVEQGWVNLPQQTLH